MPFLAINVMKKILILLLLISLLFLDGCHSKSPPQNLQNVCEIFQQYPEWFWAAKTTRHRFGIPISVQMAIIYQESHFNSHAEPPRQRLLGFILWFRPTSASGYAQAVDGTWRRYLKAIGKLSGNRNDFSDAIYFIGWYANLAHIKLGISKTDAFSIYLAYHEGIKGFRKKTYRHNKKLLTLASHQVAKQAHHYRIQLLRCEPSLPQKPWWKF
ncbi:hypothetical protein CbuD7D7780_11175 [Coxiella burnetii]|uniref:Hypothetical exported protein n=1 Tax=Coxiella burnetii (strain Dugway 5J108-111) TaxID=434922 RepID=A9KDB3_COXBN|nr:hypothetical protein [Coxiella burnetii]ABS78238.1 hypothetical exported protein [Coxiella burnetii Dugway 5J108-111]OYK79298.1 hypothetical protein CbuD7E6568_11160 [Coxiella burnetii]OYK81379.1 hypothetical protein CbuD7D7780_11175 [Coxiella burnetii]